MFSSNIKTFLAFNVFYLSCHLPYFRFFFFFSIKENPVRSAVEIDFDWKKGGLD